MAIKVYARTVYRDGQLVRALVAAENQEDVAKAASTSLYQVQRYWTVTKSKTDVARAMANPGTMVYGEEIR